MAADDFKGIQPPRLASRPLKAPRVADVIDGRSLRVKLSAIALEKGLSEAEANRRATDLLHQSLFRGRMIAQELLEGGADGLTAARFLSSVTDEVLSALFDYTTVHVFRARNPTEGERLALLAVGGYGRGALAPSSDLDLLFVRSYKTTPWAESVIEFMLYRLWDMGLKVGHSVRTPDECVRLARKDHTIRTALLDARYLLGDAALASSFETKFREEAAQYHLPDWIADKLNERDDRLNRTGQSRFMVEPNVKESKGGLRDLEMLLWLANAIHGARTSRDLARTGAFEPRDAQALRRAHKFLWTVRCHLHFVTGRAEERLSFDLQPEIARRMGLQDRSGNNAVERFMKRYFLTARTVGALTRITSARLEESRQKSPERKPWFPSKLERELGEAGFGLRNDRIDFDPDISLEAKPIRLLQLFAVADRHGLDVHPNAMGAVAAKLSIAGGEFRKDPEAVAVFLDILASPRTPHRVLRLMNEAGLLGRFVPEYGRIVGQTQFNMYHHYTVDAHTLYLIEGLNAIEAGEAVEDLPLSSELFGKITNRRALFLAALLHDTGKGQGDQQVEGALSAKAACMRMKLPREEVELVAWLVRSHLEMSDTAQRRDLSDPRTIADFANYVGGLERLRLLFLLTVVDIRAVGPGVWNGWKGQLLRELYYATEAVLRGGLSDEASVRSLLSDRAKDARAALEASDAAEQMPLGGLEALMGLEDAYWTAFDPEDHLWHAASLFDQAETGDVRAVARFNADTSATQLILVCPDRPGLFADIGAAIASVGGDISTAGAYTNSESDDVLCSFVIQDASGGAYGADNPQQLERLRALAERAASAGAPGVKQPKQTRRAAVFDVQPSVRFDNDASADSTIIEVSGRNRPGLLRDLSRTITDSRLSIRSAHIGTYGEQACDVFYVRELDGLQIASTRRRNALAEKLLAALRLAEPDGPKTPAKSLTRARASTNR